MSQSNRYIPSRLLPIIIATVCACSGDKIVGRDLDASVTTSSTGGESSIPNGGTVALTRGASSVVATGGTVALTGGASSVVATGGAVALTGGASSVVATGGAVALTGGTAAVAGGTSPVTTGGSLGTCSTLDCLAGHRFIYQPDRIWNRAIFSGSPEGIPEAQFNPYPNAPSYLVSFSADGKTASLAEVVSTSYPDPQGPRSTLSATSALYELDDGWAGESLMASLENNALAGALTYFGSGVPIIEATRGSMVQSSTYDNNGDVCGLPLGVLPSGIPTTYDEALAQGNGCGQRCAGIRNGYCGGSCPGYLVLEDRCWYLPISIAFDIQTHELVGYAWGDEGSAICRGHFPPHASDGSKGWDPAKVDIALGCD